MVFRVLLLFFLLLQKKNQGMLGALAVWKMPHALRKQLEKDAFDITKRSLSGGDLSCQSLQVVGYCTLKPIPIFHCFDKEFRSRTSQLLFYGKANCVLRVGKLLLFCSNALFFS